MERSRPKPEVLSAWDSPAWQEAWSQSAELIESILHEDIPELAEITDDNPLGSAEHYLAQAARFGFKSPQAEAARRYVADDTRTAGFEALIKRGHISTVKAGWQSEQSAFTVAGRPVWQVSARGLANPQLNNAEFIRRSVELNVSLFIDRLYEQGRLEGKAVVWLSPFAHDMADAVADRLGYHSRERTFMVRWLYVENGQLISKQLNMSGSDPARMSQLLKDLSVSSEAMDELSSTGILATPMIVDADDFPGGPADIARLIDRPGEFLGGPPNGQSYERLEEISRAREALFHSQIDDLAEHIIILEAARQAGRLSTEQAKSRYKTAVENFIDAVAALDPELAREAIGDTSAGLYLAAQQAAKAGNPQSARALSAQAAEAKLPIHFCGMEISAKASQTSPNGTDSLFCPEFKIGQHVVCPDCHRAQIIVSSNLTSDRLYCANSRCDLARVKRRPRRPQPAVKAKPSNQKTKLYNF